MSLVRRGIALGVPGLALAGAVGAWAQVRRVAVARLPQFPDGDPTGTYGDPRGATARITVLGDSTITGPGLAHASEVWVARIAERSPRRVELRSLARGGSRVRDVLLEQVPRAVATPTDLFVLAVGANDVMHATPGPAFRRDLDEVLGRLTRVAPVVTFGIGDLSMVPRLPWSLKPVVARRCAVVDRIHRRVASGRSGVVRVSVTDLADAHFKAAEVDIWAADRFHPNHLGHEIWARSFGPSIHRALEAAAPVVDLRDAAGRHGEVSAPAS